MNKAIEAVAAPAGFTLVEDEDVAFCLRLCREVNRIYGRYHEDRLPSTDPLRAILAMTAETLAALSRTVKDGMPGIRITVATAQTREMLAVLFDQDPMQYPTSRTLLQPYRSMLAEPARPAVTSIFQPRTQGPGQRRGSGWLRLLGRRHRRRQSPETEHESDLPLPLPVSPPTRP
jgi:hypothetical protein